MKIGIFDSGVGGKSFVEKIYARFPEAEVVYIEDRENIPYGDKTKKQLLELTTPLFMQFVELQCDAVLVACNTVTTTIISELRGLVSLPLVGVEPMIKTAAEMTKTGVVAVCATPATLKSERYAYLKNNHASQIRVEEPDCSSWAYMIENNRQNELQLSQMIDRLRAKNTDVIVLGCTHYHWIEDELRELAVPDMKVIQPIEPVLNQLEQVLKDS